MNNLPIYYFKVNDYNDVSVDFSAIAMVDKPAIMTEWMAFDSQEKSNYFKFAIQEERRIVTAPILIPDLPIYRKIKDEKTGKEKEFYVAASRDTIEKLVMKFMKEGKMNNIKSTHQQESDKTKGVFMFIIKFIVRVFVRTVVSIAMFIAVIHLFDFMRDVIDKQLVESD